MVLRLGLPVFTLRVICFCRFCLLFSLKKAACTLRLAAAVAEVVVVVVVVVVMEVGEVDEVVMVMVDVVAVP